MAQCIANFGAQADSVITTLTGQVTSAGRGAAARYKGANALEAYTALLQLEHHLTVALGDLRIFSPPAEFTGGSVLQQNILQKANALKLGLEADRNCGDHVGMASGWLYTGQTDVVAIQKAIEALERVRNVLDMNPII